MPDNTPREAPRVALLRVRTRGQSSRHALSPGELVTIGRSSTCGVQVRDQSVSREHCVAIYSDGRVYLNDLRSTHGIVHRGERVDRCELEPGDSCHLGNVLLLFEQSGSARGVAPKQGARAEAEEEPLADETDDDAEAAVESAAAAGSSADAGSEAEADAHAEAEGAVVGSAAGDRAQEAPEIPGYRLIDRLGEGGFGVVWRAEHLQLGRQVALKVMKPGGEDHDARVAAFLREARIAARLSNPHLVQVFDVGDAQGVYYLSMELIEGGSLVRRLRRDGPMAWEEALDLLHDMAEALRAAHEAGIVHRDVKPANILLGADGRARLTDLGLAGGDDRAGTVAFMSPEQLRRMPADARADIYSLGCTIYAALTGGPPFQGSKRDIARAHVHERAASFQERSVQVPWHLQQLILESMLAKDPADRPQSAAALLERLDRLILPGAALPQASATSTAPGARPPGARMVRVRDPKKALLARLAAESITVAMVTALVIATLLLLKYRWPEMDIYRLIGR